MHNKLPALVAGLDFKTYLEDPMDEPSLTSSLVKALLNTAPRRVWEETKRLNKDAESEKKTTFDLGSAAHRLFTGAGQPIVEIDAKAFNTNAAKEQRDAAYAAGKTPILKHNMPRVHAMAQAALEQVLDNPDIGELFSPGRQAELLREVTIMWREGGVSHRARPDFYHPDENIMIHYKTTGTAIAPSTLSKYAANLQWDLTAAHYDAAGRALKGKSPRQFFLVQETAKPHLILTSDVDKVFLENGLMRRERAMTIWGRCLASNTWPGNISRTIKLECPEWYERQLIADKDAEEAAKSEGTDLLEIMRHWQAPEGWQPPAVQGERQDEEDVIE